MEISKKKGKMIMWCPDCGGLDEDGNPKGMWFRTSEATFKNKCPKCRKTLTERRCTRCGHRWVPRTYQALSAVCPKCSSPFWNRERMLTFKNNGEVSVDHETGAGKTGAGKTGAGKTDGVENRDGED